MAFSGVLPKGQPRTARKIAESHVDAGHLSTLSPPPADPAYRDAALSVLPKSGADTRPAVAKPFKL